MQSSFLYNDWEECREFLYYLRVSAFKRSFYDSLLTPELISCCQRDHWKKGKYLFFPKNWFFCDKHYSCKSFNQIESGIIKNLFGLRRFTRFLQVCPRYSCNKSGALEATRGLFGTLSLIDKVLFILRVTHALSIYSSVFTVVSRGRSVTYADSTTIIYIACHVIADFPINPTLFAI